MWVVRKFFGRVRICWAVGNSRVWSPNLLPIWNTTQQPESTSMRLVHPHTLTARKRNYQVVIPIVCIDTYFTTAVGSEHPSVQSTPPRSGKALRGSKAFPAATCWWPNRAMYSVPIKIQGKLVRQLCQLSLELWTEWDYAPTHSRLLTILFTLWFLHEEPRK